MQAIVNADDMRASFPIQLALQRFMDGSKIDLLSKIPAQKPDWYDESEWMMPSSLGLWIVLPFPG